MDVRQEFESTPTRDEDRQSRLGGIFGNGRNQKTVVGFDKRKALLTAVGRVITSQELQSSNCLEIAEVTTASFLKMHYVTVTAYSRHIQQKLGLTAPIKLRLWNAA